MASHEQSHHSIDGLGAEVQQHATGPIRSSKPDDREKKGPIAAPVKSACTFCRSRKSRCDGNKPCSACVGRGCPNECQYTVSRRGGKPKPKFDPTQDLQSHLNKLFTLTDIPYAMRRPGGLVNRVPEPSATNIYPEQQALGYAPTSYIADQAPFASPSALPQSQLPGQSLPMDNSLLTSSYESHVGGFVRFVPSAPQHPLLQHQGGYLQPSQPFVEQQSQGQQQQYQQSPHRQQDHQLPAAEYYQPLSMSGYAPSSSAQQQMTSPSQSYLPLVLGQDSALHSDNNLSAPPTTLTAPGTVQRFETETSWPKQEELSAAYHASSNDAESAPSDGTTNVSADNGIGAANIYQMSSNTLRAATEEMGTVKSLLVDYYRYLYRFIPVLPRAVHLETAVRYYKPESPFILALQCVLPLLRDEIQPVGAFHNIAAQGINFGSQGKRAALRERTNYFDRKANEGLDELLAQADRDETGEKTLEAIQTLCVLVIFEYGSGRAVKARLKADQALGLAMGLGLHKLNHKSSPDELKAARSSFAYASNAMHPFASMGVDIKDVFEMRKRCWWSVWTLVLWAAYNTGRIPTIRADDSRVKSEMPVASDPDVWPSNISSLQALLLVQDRVLALAQLGQSEDTDQRYQPGLRRSDLVSSPRHAVSPSSVSSLSVGRLGTSRSASVSSSEEIPSTFSTLPTRASRQEILDSMLEIDDFLQERIRALERTRLPDSPFPSEVPQTDDLSYVEKELEDSLRMGSAVQLYTSSLTLHIGQAFQGASLFERKLCFLNSIHDNSNGSNDQVICREPMPAIAYDDIMDLAQYVGTNEDSSNISGFASNQTAGSFSSPISQPQANSSTPQDLYTRGPFLPRVSLQRCVHASRKLLDIAKRRHGQAINPNPFNGCSFVLISFVLLMQALAVHGGFSGDGVDTEDDEGMDNNIEMDGRTADESWQNLLNQDAGTGVNDDDVSMGEQRLPYANPTGVDPVKQARLHDIWSHVREARDTLIDLGKHWEAVIPMADEVNLCLQTSQLLLSSTY